MANETPSIHYSHMNSGDRPDQFSSRNATEWAGFLIPHLKSGMSVLDCGCGSGSITLGLAEAVAPGKVIGIDAGESPIKFARESAAKQSVSNVRFDVGSVYEIPFEDESFDAVLANMVLSHLCNPDDALKEMYRVLKPGGVIGISDIDVDGGFLLSPPDDPIHEMYELWFRVWEHNGGNPRIGKHFRKMLHETGFSQVRGMTRSHTRGTREEIEAQGTITFSSMLDSAAKLGWAELDAKDKIEDQWKAFAARPGAFLSYNFCQAIGWKE